MQSETKSHVDQLTSPAGTPVTVLRFEGDIASTSKDAVLGTYQALPKNDGKKIPSVASAAPFGPAST